MGEYICSGENKHLEGKSTLISEKEPWEKDAKRAIDVEHDRFIIYKPLN